MSESFGILTGFGHHRSVSSISELDQILDEIVDQARNADAPVAISLFYPNDTEDVSATALLFGLGRAWSILEWGDAEIQMYVPGDEDGGEPSAWWYYCDYSEYPPGRGVPIEIVRAAAREFVRTRGERAEGLLWIVESSNGGTGR